MAKAKAKGKFQVVEAKFGDTAFTITETIEPDRDKNSYTINSGRCRVSYRWASSLQEAIQNFCNDNKLTLEQAQMTDSAGRKSYIRGAK